jgi:hypothetical protein
MMRLRLYSVFLFAALAWAGDSNQWSNLARLKPGTNVLVVQANGLRLEGKYQSHSDTAITFRTVSGEYAVGKDRVVRVSTKPAHRRLRNILIGLGAGAGAGAAVWAGSHRGDDFYPALIIAPGLAAVGAVAGALIPTSLFTTVYRVDGVPAKAGFAPPAPGVLATAARRED